MSSTWEPGARRIACACPKVLCRFGKGPKTQEPLDGTRKARPAGFHSCLRQPQKEMIRLNRMSGNYALGWSRKPGNPRTPDYDSCSMFPHAGRQGEAMVAGEFLSDLAKLQLVMPDMHGLHYVHIDPRPDDMVVLAPVVGDVKDDRARLSGKPQLFFGALDQLEILLTGETALPGVGIDRQAVDISPALCRF